MPEKALLEKANTMDNTFSTVLPEDFDGSFYFTNWSDEDSTHKWDGKAYTYPSNKTTRMIIVNATPNEVQNIRKKFARELAEREFFKSKKYDSIRAREGVKDENGVIKPLLQSFKQAGEYNLDSELAPGIQRCLEPLPLAKQIISEAPKDNIEEKLKKDDDGDLRTQIATPGKPLKLKERA